MSDNVRNLPFHLCLYFLSKQRKTDSFKAQMLNDTTTHHRRYSIDVKIDKQKQGQNGSHS